MRSTARAKSDLKTLCIPVWKHREHLYNIQSFQLWCSVLPITVMQKPPFKYQASTHKYFFHHKRSLPHSAWSSLLIVIVAELSITGRIFLFCFEWHVFSVPNISDTFARLFQPHSPYYPYSPSQLEAFTSLKHTRLVCPRIHRQPQWVIVSHYVQYPPVERTSSQKRPKCLQWLRGWTMHQK